MSENLRKVDMMNSMDLDLHIDSQRTYIEDEPFLGIRDAENELVCLVPDKMYKDWEHAVTIKRLLEWAAENYPYREVD